MASTATSESSASQLLRLLANHGGVAEVTALDAPDAERAFALRIRDDVDRRRVRETELSALVDTARDLASLSDPSGVLERITALLGPSWLQPDRALEIQLALRLLRLMSPPG